TKFLNRTSFLIALCDKSDNLLACASVILVSVPVCLSNLYCIRYLLSRISALTSRYFFIALFISSSLIFSLFLSESKILLSVTFLTFEGACLSLCCLSSFEFSLAHAVSMTVSMRTNVISILFFIKRIAPLKIVQFILIDVLLKL